MKKLILVFVILLLAGNVWAEAINLPDLIQKIPTVEQGVVYNLSEEAWQPMTSVPVAKWKALGVNFGYVGPDKAAVSMSIELLKLSDFTTLPILEYIVIKPCYFYSIDRLFDEGKFSDSHGFGTSLFEVKF